MFAGGTRGLCVEGWREGADGGASATNAPGAALPTQPRACTEELACTAASSCKGSDISRRDASKTGCAVAVTSSSDAPERLPSRGNSSGISIASTRPESFVIQSVIRHAPSSIPANTCATEWSPRWTRDHGMGTNTAMSSASRSTDACGGGQLLQRSGMIGSGGLRTQYHKSNPKVPADQVACPDGMPQLVRQDLGRGSCSAVRARNQMTC